MKIEDLKTIELLATPRPWGYCVQCPSEDAEELDYCACGPIHTAFDGAGDCPEFDQADRDSKLIQALRNLAPELLALWEACNTEKVHRCLGDIAEEALDALNAKASEVQP